MINHEAPPPLPLFSFKGNRVQPLVIVTMIVKAQNLEFETEFSVTKNPSPFHAVLGQPWIHHMKAVPSIYHQCIKFVSPTGEKPFTETKSSRDPATWQDTGRFSCKEKTI